MEGETDAEYEQASAQPPAHTPTPSQTPRYEKSPSPGPVQGHRASQGQGGRRRTHGDRGEGGEGEGEGEGEYEDEDEDEEEDDEGEDEEEEEPPPPPRSEDDKELLFLIEFMVDTLTLYPDNMNLEDIDPCALQGPTSVILTFLHFPPMQLSETDTDPCRRTGSDVIQYNSGKSLMFALTESQFEEPPPIFLVIAATKDMPHAFRFSKIAIGKAKIQLSELFKQVFEKYDESPNKTVSKSIKDNYMLIGDGDKVTADVSLYIRLTCMGQNIVTEFQKAEEPEEPMLFKSKESKKVYECKEQPGEGDGGSCGLGDRRRSCDTDIYVPPHDPEDENFEEIYAEINGSAIRVKVEKSKRKDPPKPYHISDFCDCNIPLPPELVAGMSDLSVSPGSEGSIRNLTTNFTPTTVGPCQSGGGSALNPKDVGLDSANQLLFSVPPMHAHVDGGGSTIVYNVNTCQDNTKHGHDVGKSFRVLTDNNPDGPPPKMPNDMDKDVFILRIIKRGRNENGKGTLSLEFKTPKEKIEAPKRPPYFVDMGVGPDKPKKK